MALGRITGPLLSQNLFRDDIPLVFYNSSTFEYPTLYLNVSKQSVGVRTIPSPDYALDVGGDLHAIKLVIDTTGTIGLVTISSDVTATITTQFGPLIVQPSGEEKIYLNSDVEISKNFTVELNGLVKGDFTATNITATNIYALGDIHAVGNITAEGNIVLGNSTATDTLIVDAEIKSDLIPFIDSGTSVSVISDYNIGSSSTVWNTAYIDRIRSVRELGQDNSSTSELTVFPNPILNSDGFPTNTLSINGDIRVYGANPIGTAPVVKNVLYVTEDGDDNNDGRALDSSRACRTISGAVNSPFYKEGTVIKVQSGYYYENNPIELKPYTCVIGDDLRTTFVEPLNKTVDLFHVNSGVYIAQMKFMNLRRGEVTRYAPGGAGTYTTGAYCVAFPPSLNNPIDLFFSPYIQNCTNQSGPWLNDGTMFVPNQTVQAPSVVGTSTYSAGTTTLIVNVIDETTDLISIGDAVNGAGILINDRIPVAVVTDIRNPNINYHHARLLIEGNRTFVQAETIAYINAIKPSGFTYNTATCYRDAGLIVDAIKHDAILGSVKETARAGFSYWSGNTSLIPGEESLTISAIAHIATMLRLIVNNEFVTTYQNPVAITQYFNLSYTGGSVTRNDITNAANIITSIITYGASIENASTLLSLNRSFIQEEVVAYINNTYPSFVYDKNLCYRDVGLIIDAVQYDLLHLTNIGSIKAGKAYWVGAISRIEGEITQTVAAIDYINTIATKIITNTPVDQIQQSGSIIVDQVINPSLTVNTVIPPIIQPLFNIIKDIIQNGTGAAPTSLDASLPQYVIDISTSTISSAVNDTLYIGQTSVFPLLDNELPIEWTTSTYADRRIDPHGAGGGALVDGNAPSLRSPIQSFVFDAFTQVNQGGHGVHIINNGYAQLVSVFTIFCDVAVHCESGGIASITNSNSNFGDLCLVAEGYGKREFGGTVVNPSSENYPLGFYPYNQQVKIFVPDPKNRPHIGLVMEVIPPETYVNYDNVEVPFVNAQGFSGFLVAAPSTDVLTTGSYTISPIDTTDIAIGHTIHVRDQYGNETDEFGNHYITTGTTVVKIEYQTITLSKPIAVGGGQVGNAAYFTIFACGNAYYSILSSTIATDIIPNGQSKIGGQEDETIDAINYLKSAAQSVVTNTTVPSLQSTSTQVIDVLYDGSGTEGFIGVELDIISTIIASGLNNAPTVKTTGTILTNAVDAVVLLTLNRSFLQDQVIAYINGTYPSFNYDQRKCRRDVGLLVDALVADLATGGNFRAVEAGTTYYSRAGTYHIVQLEDNIRDPLLFVDGISVNFYQRSYMSASGYLFEYVGAGIQYGALPQVGKADPVQTKEVIQLNNGKVFFTSTDQNGNFRIGPGLVISQATGVLSGRTFEKSLFAQMTPFIIAVEAGSGE